MNANTDNKPITPCLWFDGEGEEAARFYCSLFADARITAATPVAVDFEIAGQPFVCLNGGPQYQPNPSISFRYACANVTEQQNLKKALAADGKILAEQPEVSWPQDSVWVQDRWGVAWYLYVDASANKVQRTVPVLHFGGERRSQLDEALDLYACLFPNIRSADTDGGLRNALLERQGHQCLLMEQPDSRGFAFDEGVSLTVYCDSQEEIDTYWRALSAGGREQMCGWLRDRFGLAWQILPSILPELLSDTDTAQQAGEALMEMKKINIEQLIRAGRGYA